MSLSIMDESGCNNAKARSEALVQVLSFILEKMVSTNSDPGVDRSQVTKFHAEKVPTISIANYLSRIFKYASCSPECFVLSLIYIDRLIDRHDFVLTYLNVHRIILTSIVLSAKFFDDQYFNNSYYAKVGGVTCQEMNSLELEYLFLINFSLHVTPKEYAKYYNELANHYVFANALQSLMSDHHLSSTIRHFVIQDTNQDNQLMYVTRSVVVSDKTDNYRIHPNQSPIETTHSSSKPIPLSALSKCTGQKRRSAVALGVNA